jgi:hypothetical protein
MGIADEMGRIRKLPDDELLSGLSRALGSSRGWTALVLAHLAEVDERRLHLIAGYQSLFAYCTAGLGMSEDEACRRIDVARLSRRFPILYDKLASGLISLSVAALLKHHLSDDNHVGLVAAVSGMTVAKAREVLAGWFPRPDAPPSIRKLPERLVPVNHLAPAEEGRALHTARAPAQSASERGIPVAIKPALPTRQAAAQPIAPRNRASRVEPLSPERYKIVFTAGGELKRKLELVTDLLRHTVPSGDLATIVSRALDLLLDETLRRRFAKTTRPRTAATATAPSDSAPAPTIQVASPPLAGGATNTSATTEDGPLDSAARSRHIPHAARRAVLERDGLRCSWLSPDGIRCESRAWLEHDHIARAAATIPPTSTSTAAPTTNYPPNRPTAKPRSRASRPTARGGSETRRAPQLPRVSTRPVEVLHSGCARLAGVASTLPAARMRARSQRRELRRYRPAVAARREAVQPSKPCSRLRVNPRWRGSPCPCVHANIRFSRGSASLRGGDLGGKQTARASPSIVQRSPRDQKLSGPVEALASLSREAAMARVTAPPRLPRPCVHASIRFSRLGVAPRRRPWREADGEGFALYRTAFAARPEAVRSSRSPGVAFA